MDHVKDLDRRYVEFVFRAGRHIPVLVSGIAPRLSDVRTQVEAADMPASGDVREEGAALVDAASTSGTVVGEYVAQETAAIVTQLEVADGAEIPYADLCTRLLGVPVRPVPEDALDRLHADALARASDVLGGPAPDVRAWEAAGLHGDAKLETVAGLLDAHRARCDERFPLRPHVGIELTKTDDPVVSVGAWYYGRHASVLEVNPSMPRQRATLYFEVAHNALPGDLFHLAALEERWLEGDGLLLGGLKVKNVPGNVVAEGLEDLAATFLVEDDPPADIAFVLVLEELRRCVAVNAAVALRHEGRPEREVRDLLAEVGLMTEGRVEQTVGLIKHPLWGTYVYTYVGGRNIVGPAWRAARDAGDEAAFFTMLYSELLTPAIFAARTHAAPEGAQT